MRHMLKAALGLLLGLTLFICLGASAWAEIWSGYQSFEVNESFYDDITIEGDVTLDLDNAILSVDSSIISGNNLTITGSGELRLKGETSETSSGWIELDNLTIEDGTLTVCTYEPVYVKGNLTINGGTLVTEVTGGGIFAGNVTISGGTLIGDGDGGINARQNVTINGGEVEAFCIYTPSFTINRGAMRVRSSGTVCPNTGIEAGNVTINGGKVDAIGSSKGINADILTISGGDVTARGADNGITARSVTISGGQVTAASDNDSIHARESVTISGGQVFAVSGIYGITTRSYGKVTLSWTNANDFIRLQGDNSIIDTPTLLLQKSFLGSDGKVYSSANAGDLTGIKDLKLTPHEDLSTHGSCTVTYVADNGSGETATYGPYEPGTTYSIESCGFSAPEGKVFDCWRDSDGGTYRVGDVVVLHRSLILTAQWRDQGLQIGGEGRIEITGSGGDISFFGGRGGDEWDGGYVAPQRAWKVTLAPTLNGSAALGLLSGESTATEMNIYPNTAVYVFPNADPGYRLDKIIWSLIDGSASYEITEAKNFVMPAMDAVVYVSFVPAG